MFPSAQDICIIGLIFMVILFTALASLSLYPKNNNVWKIDELAIKIYFTILAFSACLQIYSMIPGSGSTFWIGLTSQSFLYGSSAIYYLSWVRTMREE